MKLLPGSDNSQQRLLPLKSNKRALAALQSTKRALVVAHRHQAALDRVRTKALIRIRGPRVQPPRNVVEDPCHRNTKEMLSYCGSQNGKWKALPSQNLSQTHF